MKPVEREMIRWGKLLFERRLITGWGGNISCRLGKDRFLITGQHAPLGFLTAKDFVEVDGQGRAVKKDQRPSSETPLHLAVYHGTDAKAVIHAHPPMALTFSLSHESFVPLSFEEKYTIGEVPIVPQETPTVTETGKVVEELRLRPIVILRGHGTVAYGKDLKDAFLLTDLLEEAVHCKLIRDTGGAPSGTQENQPAKAPQTGESYPLFSREHMEALTASANGDAEFQQRASETNLTTTLTLRMAEGTTPWTVRFENGKIAGLEAAGGGDFAISGAREWWEAVFHGRIDPFLATQQGKLKLERGELWQLSKWFKPFQRAFALWQTIPIQ
jgi:L-fuculose-phosphate aldolase